jgi:hypothetical protein
MRRAEGLSHALVLGADAAHAGSDGAALEHLLDVAHVGEQLPRELAQPLGVEIAFDVVAAHAGGSPTQARGPALASPTHKGAEAHLRPPTRAHLYRG